MHTVYVVLLFWLGLSLLAAAVWSAARELGWIAFKVRYRDTGTRLDGGSPKHSAFTGMRELGTRTPETATTGGCSSFSLRGVRLEGEDALTFLARERSSTAPSSSIDATATLGVSGVPPAPATFDDPKPLTRRPA